MDDTGLDVSPETHPTIPDLRQAITDAVSALVPDGKSRAVIGAANQKGVVFGVATKIGKNWIIEGDITATYGSGRHLTSGRVMVYGSW